MDTRQAVLVRLSRFGLVAAMLAFGGCPGEGPQRDASLDGGGRGDGRRSEAGAGCSATGVVQACDPVAVTGCSAGACTIVKSQGPSCVCPSGTAATGEACQTSLECAPGNVCAGTKAPGICRKTCFPSVASCGANSKCTFITDFPSLGYCEPS